MGTNKQARKARKTFNFGASAALAVLAAAVALTISFTAFADETQSSASASAEAQTSSQPATQEGTGEASASASAAEEAAASASAAEEASSSAASEEGAAASASASSSAGEEAASQAQPATTASKAGSLSAKGKGYAVTLNYAAEANIPEGATLSVKELASSSSEYKTYANLAATEVYEEEVGELPYARFFDITILDAKGAAVEPAVPVTVQIDLKDADLENEDVEVAAVHIADNAKSADVVPLDVNTQGASQVATIEANSFSIYGVISYYTVDFYYTAEGAGEPAEYHMAGGSNMMLSDLFDKLGITRSSSDIQSVDFTDTSLVTFTKEGSDWKINSLKPFTTSEMLTITFTDGQVIFIGVEDDAGPGWFAGGDIYWRIQSGKLIIRPKDSLGGAEGTGYLRKWNGNNYTALTSWPWNAYRSEITEVEVQGTVIVDTGIRLEYMFANCPNLVSVNLAGLDTEYAESFKRMFQNCSALTELDLSNFTNAKKVYDMQDMVAGCSSLETFILNNESFITRTSTASETAITSGGVQLTNMFQGCTSLKTVDMSNITIYGRDSDGWNQARRLFYNRSSLESVNLSNTQFINVKDFTEMFYGCSSLTDLNMEEIYVEDAVSMNNMFQNCSSLETLDVSGFGKLEHIENMDGFVNGCTGLKVLNIDNLDNSRIGPTNNRHHTSEAIAGSTGAAEYGRMLDIHTCTALETLSAKKSNVWMCYNNRGVPGSEYYNAAFENDVYYFTDKEMEFASDVGPTVTIDSDRDYIDLITDRDGTNVPTTNPVQSPLPDASTNINIANGDLNKIGTTTNRAGMLAPGVYTLKTTGRTEPAGAPMCDTYYRIAYIGKVPYKVEGIEDGDPDLVKVDGTDNTYISTTKRVWPDSGDVVIDRTSSPIKVTYEKAAVDMNGRKYDVVITITKITFKDVGNVPTDPGSARRKHDGNNYVPTNREYYRPILQAHKSEGLQFHNYVWTGEPTEPWSKTNCLSKGSGTDIEFSISIDGAPDDTSFVFKGEDLDVAYSQNWHNDPTDACLDKLPVGDNTYGIGGEGFVLGDGNVLGTVEFAEHTGLALVEGNKVITTGSDPDTTWSEFTVKADAKGANYTWTSGVSCTSYALRNTKAQNAGTTKLQPKVLKELVNGTLKADQFEFELKEVSTDPSGIPGPFKPGVDPLEKAVPQEKKNDADGNVVFDTMEFKSDEDDGYFPGTATDNTHNTYTYTYKVSEKIPTDAKDVEGYKVKDGVVYDTSEHTVTIVITTPENETEMLRGIKAAVYVDKTPGAGVEPDKVYWHQEKTCVDCSNGTPTTIPAEKWYDEDGNEIDDPNPFLLTGVKFKNQEVKTTLNIPVQKILQGRPWKDTDEFAAGLVLVSADAPMPENTQTIGAGEKVSEVIIDSQGTPVKKGEKVIGYKTAFDTITYNIDDVGTHEYNVRELMPAESSVDAIPGVTYDAEKYAVEVKVELDDTDPDDLKLVATATYKNAQGETVTLSSFTNVYDAEETSYKMEAVKDYFDVTEGKEIKLTGNEFLFAVRPIGENAAIAPMPEDTEGTGADRVFYKGNEDDGDIEFERNPDGIKDGMVFNYKALLEAGVDDAALHSDKGVDFEYVLYEIIPGTPEGIAKGKTLTGDETLVNNEDGTYSVIGDDQETVYDGVHHTRKITVKVIQGDATETGETVTVEGQQYDVYKDFNEVEFYEKDGKAYKKADNTLFTPDLETLDVEGHADDHNACYYVSEKGGKTTEVPMSDVEGYDPERHHFKVDEHGDEVLGAPIFINYRFDQKYVALKATKVWDDADDQDKIRPASITLNIKSDEGDYEPTALVVKGDSWTASEKLPVYEFDIKEEKVKEITYSVVEKVPAGYTVSYDPNPSAIKFDPATTEFALTVTNKHTPGEGAIEGDETWGLKGEPQTGTPKYDVNPQNPVTPTGLVKPDKPGASISDDGKTVTIPGEGIYVLNADGTITFRPEPDFLGDPTPVDVQGVDKQGNVITATYTPHVIDPTDSFIVSRTIHFTYETKDGKQVTDMLVQTGTITRKATKVDPKTGEVLEWGPWGSYTFPAVKNPDKEAGPEWATKDIAGELTVYGPEPVADVYIVYHKKTPAPTPAPKTNPAGTGDAAPLGPLAALALAGVAGIGLALGMRRRNATAAATAVRGRNATATAARGSNRTQARSSAPRGRHVRK